MKFGVLVMTGAISLAVCMVAVSVQTQAARDTTLVSFKSDVMPVIKKSCLPCHAEDNFNPSELSLDSYELLMEGGKHGTTVTPGRPAESLLIQKLGQNPPFGDRMPLDPKRKKGEPSSAKLSDEEIQLIDTWVEQGAKNN